MAVYVLLGVSLIKEYVLFVDTRKISENTKTLQITGTCSYLNTFVSLKEVFKGMR